MHMCCSPNVFYLFICLSTFLDVNIGFRQSEYTVYDWINSTVQICIWLSMGVLERNVTITVGTETAHNTTGTFDHFSNKSFNF